MFRIVFTSGSLQGRRLTVRQGRVRLGRGADCAIRLNDPAAADRHAELEERHGVVTIRNLDPVGGLTVNGARLAAEPREIGTLDEVRLGSTVFHVEPAATGVTSGQTPRRTGALQAATYAAIVVVLVLQGFIIVRFARLRADSGIDAPGATATNAIPAEAPAETPSGAIPTLGIPSAPAPAPEPRAESATPPAAGAPAGGT